MLIQHACIIRWAYGTQYYPTAHMRRMVLPSPSAHDRERQMKVKLICSGWVTRTMTIIPSLRISYMGILREITILMTQAIACMDSSLLNKAWIQGVLRLVTGFDLMIKLWEDYSIWKCYQMCGVVHDRYVFAFVSELLITYGLDVNLIWFIPRLMSLWGWIVLVVTVTCPLLSMSHNDS